MAQRITVPWQIGTLQEILGDTDVAAFQTTRARTKGSIMAKLPNKLRDLLKQRLRELQLKAEGANCTEHGTTRGDLREGLLRDFLEELPMGDRLWDFIVPFFVFAYRTDVSMAGLEECLMRFPNLLGVVIFGNKYLYRGKQGVAEIDDSDFDGTLAFVSQLCFLLARQSVARPMSHLVWQAYLEGYEETKG
jgi:hypothetical protein